MMHAYAYNVSADWQRYVDDERRNYDDRRQKRKTVSRQKDSHLTLRVNDRRGTPKRRLTGYQLGYVSYQDLEFIKQIMPGNWKV
jgi:hypothetical protein